MGKKDKKDKKTKKDKKAKDSLPQEMTAGELTAA